MKLTIFTPTYNRAHLLPALYQSIVQQARQDEFEWLIVDDGSRDNTKEVIKGFWDQGIVNINYVYQENAGKMQAHNTALRHAKGDWFFCVDSDDRLVAQSLSWFFEIEAQYVGEEKLAGILTFKKLSNSKRKRVDALPVEDETRLNLKELFCRYTFEGEVGVFFLTDVLRKYPFPKFEGENYQPESIVYDQIDRKYHYVTYNKYLQECAYQEDGYTFNTQIFEIRNPKGTANFYNQKARYTFNIILKMKYYAIYCAYSILGKSGKIIRNCHNPFLCLFAYPVGKRYSKKLVIKRNELLGK